MIVSGVPERTPNHAAEILETALDILLQMDQLKNPETGLPLNIQIGKLIISILYMIIIHHEIIKMIQICGKLKAFLTLGKKILNSFNQ